MTQYALSTDLKKIYGTDASFDKSGQQLQHHSQVMCLIHRTQASHSTIF